jgi:type I restriction enzyme S subunit
MKIGWTTEKLENVCVEITDGSHFSPKTSDDGYPYITVRDIVKDKIDFNGCRCVSKTDFNQLSKNGCKPRKGDILFSKDGTVGKIAIVDQDTDFVVLSSLAIVRPDTSRIDSFFLKYVLQSPAFLEEAIGKKTGVAIRRIILRNLKSIPVHHPPLPEQQRIVAILDEAFDGIVTAKANAEKNLKNARALFDSYLNSVFSQRGDGWVDRTLDQVCIVERGSSPRPIKSYFTNEPDGVNWIKIGDTQEGGKYVYSTAQKITPEGAQKSRFVKEGDFILTNSMSFGRPYIMKTCGCVHDGWFVLRLNMSIDTDYFFYLLSSGFVQDQFAMLAQGAVVKNISGDLVKKAVLPIPPLTQQENIVTKLLELSAETQRLESIYRKKITALDALKKSILHKAFSGEL